jgi:hypothetical protein
VDFDFLALTARQGYPGNTQLIGICPSSKSSGCTFARSASGGGFITRCYLLGHRDGFEDVALFVLLEVKVFAVAAMLVLLAAAARTRSVAGDFLVGHGSALISELLLDGFNPRCWRAA